MAATTGVLIVLVLSLLAANAIVKLIERRRGRTYRAREKKSQHSDGPGAAANRPAVLHESLPKPGSDRTSDAAQVQVKTESTARTEVNQPEERERSYVAKPLMSAAELRFYEALRDAIGSTALIFTKIAMHEIVKSTGHWSGFNAMSQKSVDFVLCIPRTMQPVLVIELDDSSHKRSDRKKRDELVDSILSEVGLPILHIKCRAEYDVNALRQQVRQAAKNVAK